VAAVEHHGGAGTTTTTTVYRTPIAAPAECARSSVPVRFTGRRGFDILDQVDAPVGAGSFGCAESPVPVRSRSMRERCAVRPPRIIL
jgi:hypothetical protein